MFKNTNGDEYQGGAVAPQAPPLSKEVKSNQTMTQVIKYIMHHQPRTKEQIALEVSTVNTYQPITRYTKTCHYNN